MRFGPAGKPVEYSGPTKGIPEFLERMGLDAFEYQAVRGVKLKVEDALTLRGEAKKHSVQLSIHAPYYINFSSSREAVVEKSKIWLYEAARIGYYMGAYVVVFHPGYYGGLEPKEAVDKVISGLKEVVEKLKGENLKVMLGVETTGKKSQVGSLEEVLRICNEVDMTVPVIDWAHLYARSEGKNIISKDDVVKVIDTIEEALGSSVIKKLHMHFSKIAYGKGGEREHHTLDEEEYGPNFEIVCEGLIEMGVEGTIISESPILEKDAIKMKNIYEAMLKRLRGK